MTKLEAADDGNFRGLPVALGGLCGCAIGLRRRQRHERLQLEKARLADAAHVHQFLDLLAEDSQLNVYAGELEVRPPGAPTTQGGSVAHPIAKR